MAEHGSDRAQPVDHDAAELSPDDETGSGAGWNLTATSTTFTSGARTLPDHGGPDLRGSATAGTGQCSVPVNQISYPVTVPAAHHPPAAVKVFNAAAGTGQAQRRSR